MAAELWFLRRILLSRTMKKCNDEVLEEVQRTLMKRIRQRQLAFLKRQGLENLVVTERKRGGEQGDVRD